jgi:hypothetical protein
MLGEEKAEVQRSQFLVSLQFMMDRIINILSDKDQQI